MAPVDAVVRSGPDTALARVSAAAVRGVVTAVEAATDPGTGAPYTYVTIAAARAWGFPAAPSHVVLKLLGGVTSQAGLAVGGQAAFAVGEDVMAFLEVRPRDGSLSVTGLELGKWTIGGPGREAPAVRQLHAPAPGDRIRAAVADLEALAALAGTAVRLPAGWTAQEPATGNAVTTAADGDLPSQARWHDADWGSPVRVDSQADGHPLFPGGGFTQVLRALGLWSAGGALRLEPGTLRAPRCFANPEPADGRISISYGDPCGEIADSSPTLAIGGVYFNPLDVRVVDGVAYGRATKGMVVLDDVPAKFAGFSTGCYEELIVHELGHAIGLPHTSAQPSVMAPWLDGGCVNRSESQPLRPADLVELQARYPAVVPGEGPPGTPGALTAVVEGTSVRLAWAPASGPPASAYHLVAGSVPGGADIGAVALGAPSFAATGVVRGTYYVRIIAVNAAGSSAPTADVTVVVGDGLPGAPVGVMAAAGPSGSVRVLWQPPVTGATPHSYTLLVGTSPGHPTTRIPVGSTVLAATGVAAGTYFVRAVGVNDAGAGPASAEIAVVVP